MKRILYGAAYYDEYMPHTRLEKDIKMMKKAGMNTVRIAESTWSTFEPQEGVFDFSSVERVMNAMDKAGINVIIGTPTYAVPAWMIKLYPEIMAETVNGRGFYGPRQIMDITHPGYLYYCERIIRELMKRTAHRRCVIGFQLDNETKYYGTAGRNVQDKFIKYLRRKFKDDIEAVNRAFGLSYWSNSIHSWEDFPDVRGTINGSLGAEFDKFRRTLVTKFLNWQASIVKEYKREEQFITHNFDFEWRGYSFGIQPDVNQYEAAKCVTVVGADIYHPTQAQLTGAEIAFGGDVARSLKQDNYLTLETEAQGYPGWLPYKGQLRLQAYSHIASGANGVMYWPWHSIHNACETYWKGVLSHDFAENEIYKEACRIGKELQSIGSRITDLKKKNDTALLVSNEAFTGIQWFGIDAKAADNGKIGYNDVVRWVYDTLYKMNVECDFIWPEMLEEHSPEEGQRQGEIQKAAGKLEKYRLIVVPALYAVSDKVLKCLERYVKNGGNLAVTFKSGFADENVKVSCEVQPRILKECLGIRYHQFTFPEQVRLRGKITENVGKNSLEAKTFMELLITEGAEVLASYEHNSWKDYAAVTVNRYGKGSACYIGCMMDEVLLREILLRVFKEAGIERNVRTEFPVIVREGVNDSGKEVRFFLNYSEKIQEAVYNFSPDKLSGQSKATQAMAGEDILSGDRIEAGDKVSIPGWGVRIIEGI